MSLKERVENLEEKVRDMSERVEEIESRLELARKEGSGSRLEKTGSREDKARLESNSNGEGAVTAFPALKKNEEKIKEQVYDYVEENNGLTSLTVCAKELELEKGEVKEALVQLKLEGKVDF